MVLIRFEHDTLSREHHEASLKVLCIVTLERDLRSIWLKPVPHPEHERAEFWLRHIEWGAMFVPEDHSLPECMPESGAFIHTVPSRICANGLWIMLDD